MEDGSAREAALKAQLVDYAAAAGGGGSIAPVPEMPIQKLEARLTEVSTETQKGEPEKEHLRQNDT